MPTRILAILDLSVPSSTSDGGTLDGASASERAAAMLDAGADMIAVTTGGPGAGDDAEIEQVVPIVESLAARTRVAIATGSAAVAQAALVAGASIIDDLDGSLHPIAAEAGAAWIATDLGSGVHGATPVDADIVASVATSLAERAGRAVEDGVAEIWVDPGIGQGKSAEEDVALLANLDRMSGAGWPVVCRPGPASPAAITAFAITRGADVVRAGELEVKALKQAAIVAAGHVDLRRSAGVPGQTRS